MNLPDVAGTVRAELARQRKPQQELQKRLGVSRSTMRRRLSGEHPFDADQLVTVASFLGMSVSELLGESRDANAISA